MQRDWELEELIASWTLDEADWLLLSNKTGATRLGFALLLKFFELEGRFPHERGELPEAVVAFMAGQVKVDPAAFAHYSWSGRAVKYHRAQIRRELGFREATSADEERMADWLARELCPVDSRAERLRDDLLARFREERIEPPGASRLDRILGAARSLFERRFTSSIVERLPAVAVDRLERLIGTAGDGLLAELKGDPGRASLNTILEELEKLERVRAVGLPAGLFADCSETLIAAWRARASAAYPSDLRRDAAARAV